MKERKGGECLCCIARTAHEAGRKAAELPSAARGWRGPGKVMAQRQRKGWLVSKGDALPKGEALRMGPGAGGGTVKAVMGGEEEALGRGQPSEHTRG